MTKRFILYEHKDNDYILDNPNVHLDFIEMLGDALTSKEIVDLLNEQHETIQKLNQQLRIFSGGLKAEIRETKEVFEDYSECVDEKKQLKQENEQLKKENYELHKRLGDFEPFEEHIQERTSKTSLKDIIGIVKTDEPTNSVELKKELYK